MRFIKYYLLFLAFAPNNYTAAQHKVSGKVLDQYGEPIVGASIQVEGTYIGTVANFDGDFSLEVPDTCTLVFASVGYCNETVNVYPSNTYFDMVLTEDVADLDDVIVVCYWCMSANRLDMSYTTTWPDLPYGFEVSHRWPRFLWFINYLHLSVSYKTDFNLNQDMDFSLMKENVLKIDNLYFNLKLGYRNRDLKGRDPSVLVRDYYIHLPMYVPYERVGGSLGLILRESEYTSPYTGYGFNAKLSGRIWKKGPTLFGDIKFFKFYTEYSVEATKQLPWDITIIRNSHFGIKFSKYRTYSEIGLSLRYGFFYDRFIF